MKLKIYSADHSNGIDVDWFGIPRVGDSIVLPLNDAEKVYDVEVVRWLVDQAGNQIAIEVHMGIAFDSNGCGHDQKLASSGKGSLASSS